MTLAKTKNGLSIFENTAKTFVLAKISFFPRKDPFWSRFAVNLSPRIYNTWQSSKVKVRVFKIRLTARIVIAFCQSICSLTGISDKLFQIVPENKLSTEPIKTSQLTLCFNY